MEDKKEFGTKKHVAIVNSVTAARFLGSFGVIPVFQALGGTAAALFSVVFLLTDWIDGFLARKLKASTFFGALFDGTGDKIYGIMCFLLLMTINPVVFSIPLLMELGIVLVQIKKLKSGLNVQSNMTGKVKTWFLGASIVGSFLAVDLLNMPPLLDYIKYSSLDKIQSIKDFFVLLGIQMPSIVMQILTLSSYKKEIKNGLEEKEQAKEVKHEETIFVDTNPKLEEIEIEKETLENKKSLLEQAKIMVDTLFDPAYYAENKNMPISELKRELLKNGKNTK